MNEQQQNSIFRSRTDFFDDVAEMLFFSLVYSFNHFNNNNNNNTSNSAVSLLYIL